MLSAKLSLLFSFQFIVSICQNSPKQKLTLDDFFDNTDFQLLSFSPTNQHLLIQTRHASWNTSSFETSLWVYRIETKSLKLITNRLAVFSKPQWSPSGNYIAIFIKTDPIISREAVSDHFIYIYSVTNDKLVPVSVGTNIPFNVVWGTSDTSVFFTSILYRATNGDENEWKNIIRFRETSDVQGTAIYHMDLKEPTKLVYVKNVSFIIGEFLFSSYQNKLVFTSVSRVIEKIDVMEIYSIDLRHPAEIFRLTKNEGIEQDLKLSRDGTKLFFRLFTLGSSRSQFTETFDQLFSLNLIDGHIEQFAKEFDGSVTGYAIKADNGVFIVGQIGTEVQIFEQKSLEHKLLRLPGWTGTYALMSTSSQTDSIAVVHSSFEKPKEVYLANHIDEIQSAQAITSFNQLFTQRDLPRSIVYQWRNEDENRTIEGILRFPPGKFEQKQLPLLVLIHGGLYAASVNGFQVDWENWGILAASEGWLVLEPNYRGSTGYGSQFVHEVRYQFLSRPATDILAGVDQLINEGIADSNRLAVGGYSYGGYLTNWLITQTTRFNAALSGAGAVEHTSEWGTIDLPIFEYYLLGGAPWEVPEIYQDEAAVYQLNKVRTPTHIVTGQNDVRVNPSQSYILERALQYLGIPVHLLIFPNEDHSISNNPWHGKIKVREELKWLQKYGHQSFNKMAK